MKTYTLTSLRRILAVIFIAAFLVTNSPAQILKVKPATNAIVKFAPTGNAEQFPDRLAPETRVQQMGQSGVYYNIRLSDGRTGWSYKGNFVLVSATGSLGGGGTTPVTAQTLLARSDVLKIIVIDVEVGDATLIICPREGDKQDIILIDAGENDADRIKDELIRNDIPITGRPIRRFINSHYDSDHFGGAPGIVPLSEQIYDRGTAHERTTREMKAYKKAIDDDGGDRRTMTLNYQETFSGGVSFECVAANKATDCDPSGQASASDENSNSLALVLTYNDFDYFTGGDLTLGPEKSLANCIKNCDVYHVNHHGSKVTSSDSSFVGKLDPEVSVVSNGTRHGHPTKDVAERLLGFGSRLYQTNVNPNASAYQADPKFVADDTFHDEDDDAENDEGAAGTIRIVVDPVTKKYFVIMPGLPLSEATFTIEQ